MRSPHDAARLAQVHPDGWENPRPAGRYDLVVVGAGTAGLVSAAIGAGLGFRVALVEHRLMGGDCLNAGCVPSKGVLAAAHAWHAARQGAPTFGAPPVGDGAGDFAAAFEQMRATRAELARIDGAARFRDLGVDVFLGRARFVAGDAVQVDDGGVLRFRRAVLATGARPAIPPVPGLAELAPLTNESVFDLVRRPDRLLVVGAGPVGCELAQAFARFGSQVTLVDRDARVLAREDAEAAGVVERALVRDGVTLALGATLRQAGRDAAGLPRLEGTRREGGAERPLALDGDAVLVAAGRRPELGDLGLDVAGIAHDARGVTVDDHLRTTNARVWAVGDVNGLAPFTHAADAQARLAVQNALFPGRARASALVVPRATYTSPELAQVGRTAEELAGAGTPFDTVTVPFDAVDRARLERASEGFVRVHLARGGDRILGVTIVGTLAGELIAEATLAMTAGLGLSALGRTIHPYPTHAEALRKAADQRRRSRLTPTARRALGAWRWLARRLP